MNLEIRVMRAQTKLTQTQLAGLVGVHPITVSKWERGINAPNPWQAALMGVCLAAERKCPGVCAEAATAMLAQGYPRALYTLLHAVYSTPTTPETP